MNYKQLLEYLESLSPEQLEMRAQVVLVEPDDEKVNVGLPLVEIRTVEEFGIRYIRSAADNKRNPDEVVMLLDHNIHAERGAIAHNLFTREDFYPDGHSDAADWTGPAQKLIDSKGVNNG